MTGSSPLARGLPLPLNCAPHHARDHPRSRGVYPVRVSANDRLHGSSPLARGLPYHVSATRNFRRIIPARAGFTGPGRGPLARPEDHPRSRGVYLRAPDGAQVGDGSSPLARGLPLICCPAHTRCGIIPARAGFTKTIPSPQNREEDHPRSRGVYEVQADRNRASGGSSPLARGLPSAPAVQGERVRIIPARAGFTCVCSFRVSFSWDHPRSRGVYPCASPPGRSSHGSSPLARGLPRGPDDQCRDPGSSPLARGLLPEGRVAHDGARIIPARAGFTRSSCRR